jgi:hypothetical protein
VERYRREGSESCGKESDSGPMESPQKEEAFQVLNQAIKEHAQGENKGAKDKACFPTYPVANPTGNRAK